MNPVVKRINLSALIHNYRVAKEHARRSSVIAVIKADAYGHGMISVAQALNPICDGFAVARSEEFLTLRESGIEKKTLVLQGIESGEDLLAIAPFNPDLMIHHPQQIAILKKTPLSKPLTVWLKIDTGMHRLGLSVDDIPNALRTLAQLPWVEQPVSLATHLANADDLHDPYTKQQIEQFKQHIPDSSHLTSIANSAGILRWPESHSDCNRAGIMLYGISPFPDLTGEQLGLRPVMQVESRLISTHNLPANRPVGYGGDWVSTKKTRIGVVSVGYGDGYPRAAQGGQLLVQGKPATIIGRVSMDMITVDLSQHPHANIGDTAILWGADLPVELLAKTAKTIPYELVCNLTQRVQLDFENDC